MPIAGRARIFFEVRAERRIMDDETFHEIEEDISAMAQVASPMSGNCGVFAVALSRLHPGGEFVVLRDLSLSVVNGFKQFEHVAYEIDGVMFDGQGETDEGALRAWGERRRKGRPETDPGEIEIERLSASTEEGAVAIMAGCGDDGTEPQDYLEAVLEPDEAEEAMTFDGRVAPVR